MSVIAFSVGHISNTDINTGGTETNIFVMDMDKAKTNNESKRI